MKELYVFFRLSPNPYLASFFFSLSLSLHIVCLFGHSKSFFLPLDTKTEYVFQKHKKLLPKQLKFGMGLKFNPDPNSRYDHKLGSQA